MIYLRLLFVILISVLISCHHSPPTKQTEKNSEHDATSQEEIDGPPFNDTCLCSFASLGEYKIADTCMHIYLSGKGWNPKYYSCSWTWGEIINNEAPQDSKIKLLKIHLLDLDHFSIPTNQTEYGNDSIKTYVIATYTQNKKDNPCVFDPYNTKKYPKPQHWIE